MTLQYTTKFSEKRKTLGLVVERDKSVVVLAPNGTSRETLDAFIDKKRFWLYEKINHTPKFGDPNPETPFISGKAIPYLGKNYKLDITDEPIEGIAFKGKFLLSRQNLQDGKAILEGWYKDKAKQKIVPLVERYAKQLGVEYNTILISDLKYRWGSCTLKGNLNFNWRLIKAPQFVINYVVIHELAHLLELNHSERFWNIVKVQMPNYLEAKEWLRGNGGEVLR
ncbi:MAG: M48 family metallopeptidase [Saprospiraceae bacterium]|nr:M48 family metallopeptidase [Saprospiraceae bacterium]